LKVTRAAGVIRAPHELQGVGPDVPGHRVENGLGIRARETSQGPPDPGASGDRRDAGDAHQAEEPPPSGVRRAFRSWSHPCCDEQRDGEAEGAGDDPGDQPPLQRDDEGNDGFDEGQEEEECAL
jgi:hypothetical protein